MVYTIEQPNAYVEIDGKRTRANVTIYCKTKKEKEQITYQLNRKRKIEYQKDYHEENRERYDEYQREYYEKRREGLLAKLKEKVICECGKETSRSNLTAHKKTKIHQKRMDELICVETF